MKKLILGVLSLILAIGLVGCANPNEIAPEKMKTIKFLNEAENKALFSDVKVVGKSYKYKNGFDVDFRADGTYSGTVADGKKSISGTWNVKGDVKCMDGDDGRKRCAKHYKEGDKYYTVKGNILTSEFIFIKK